MELEVKTLQIKNVYLSYVTCGVGIPLVLIPGMISDYRTWNYQLVSFAQHFMVISISRRFQYPSFFEAGSESGIESNTNDIIALFKHLKIKSAILVGHSYGGYIALNLACKYPEYVNKLIIEEPIVTPTIIKNPYNPICWLKLIISDKKAAISYANLAINGFQKTIKAISKGDFEIAKKIFIGQMFLNTKTPDDLDELTKSQLDDNIITMSAEDPGKFKFSLKELSNIFCDVLIINGDNSPYCFKYINEKLHRRIVNSKLITIQDSSHWVHIAQKDVFNNCILEFLNNSEKH